MDSILQNESTAALREVTVLVSASGTGVTGVTLSTAVLRLAKVGANLSNSANGATLTEITGGVDVGMYALRFAALDVDTAGPLRYEITAGTGPSFDTVRGDITVRPALRSVDISSGAVTAIQTGLAVPGSAMTLTGAAITAVQAGLAVPGSAMALTGDTLTAIATAILTSSLGAGHTVQGALRRADWINIGKLTGGLSVLATFYQYDGSTVGVQATQDPVLGTRTAASTAAGD